MSRAATFLPRSHDLTPNNPSIERIKRPMCGCNTNSIRLVALAGGPPIYLGKGLLMIGRHPECDVLIDSMQVSRAADCCLAEIDGEVRVCDLGSTNGIRINGRRMESGRLRLGDELRWRTTATGWRPPPARRPCGWSDLIGRLVGCVNQTKSGSDGLRGRNATGEDAVELVGGFEAELVEVVVELGGGSRSSTAGRRGRARGCSARCRGSRGGPSPGCCPGRPRRP